jgi:hypothetical protein
MLKGNRHFISHPPQTFYSWNEDEINPISQENTTRDEEKEIEYENIVQNERPTFPHNETQRFDDSPTRYSLFCLQHQSKELLLARNSPKRKGIATNGGKFSHDKLVYALNKCSQHSRGQGRRSCHRKYLATF